MEQKEKDIFLGSLFYAKCNSRAEGIGVLQEQHKCSNVNKSQIKPTVPLMTIPLMPEWNRDELRSLSMCRLSVSKEIMGMKVFNILKYFLGWEVKCSNHIIILLELSILILYFFVWGINIHSLII